MLIILPSKHTPTSFLMRFLLAFQYSSKTTWDVGMTRMYHHIWLFQDHLLGNLDMKNHSQNQCRVISKKTAPPKIGKNMIYEPTRLCKHGGYRVIKSEKDKWENNLNISQFNPLFFEKSNYSHKQYLQTFPSLSILYRCGSRISS